MREILFRGKRIDNREWIEGSLVVAGDCCCILPADESSVHPTDYPYFDPETGTIDGHLIPVDSLTVGQYTGLTANGKKIFEGDIVQENDIVHKGEIQIKGKCSTVSFEKGCWVILSNVTWDFLQTNAKAVEIIGNIHDNPELLESNP